jgi:hypothetical protein
MLRGRRGARIAPEIVQEANESFDVTSLVHNIPTTLLRRQSNAEYGKQNVSSSFYASVEDMLEDNDDFVQDSDENESLSEEKETETRPTTATSSSAPKGATETTQDTARAETTPTTEGHPQNKEESDSEVDEKLLQNYREVFKEQGSKNVHEETSKDGKTSNKNETSGSSDPNTVRGKDENTTAEGKLTRKKRNWNVLREHFLPNGPMRKFNIDMDRVLNMNKAVPYSLTIRPGFHFKGILRHAKTLVYCIHHQRMLREYKYNGDIVVEEDGDPEEREKEDHDRHPHHTGGGKQGEHKRPQRDGDKPGSHKHRHRRNDSDSSDGEAHHASDDSNSHMKVKSNKIPSCFVSYDRKHNLYLWDASKNPIPKPTVIHIRENLVEFCYISKYCIYAACAADEMVMVKSLDVSENRQRDKLTGMIVL